MERNKFLLILILINVLSPINGLKDESLHMEEKIEDQKRDELESTVREKRVAPVAFFAGSAMFNKLSMGTSVVGTISGIAGLAGFSFGGCSECEFQEKVIANGQKTLNAVLDLKKGNRKIMGTLGAIQGQIGQIQAVANNIRAHQNAIQHDINDLKLTIITELEKLNAHAVEMGLRQDMKRFQRALTCLSHVRVTDKYFYGPPDNFRGEYPNDYKMALVDMNNLMTRKQHWMQYRTLPQFIIERYGPGYGKPYSCPTRRFQGFLVDQQLAFIWWQMLIVQNCQRTRTHFPGYCQRKNAGYLRFHLNHFVATMKNQEAEVTRLATKYLRGGDYDRARCALEMKPDIKTIVLDFARTGYKNGLMWLMGKQNVIGYNIMKKYWYQAYLQANQRSSNKDTCWYAWGYRPHSWGINPHACRGASGVKTYVKPKTIVTRHGYRIPAYIPYVRYPFGDMFEEDPVKSE